MTSQCFSTKATVDKLTPGTNIRVKADRVLGEHLSGSHTFSDVSY